MHAADLAGRGRARDQPIVESLVIPFEMIVLDKRRDRASEMALPERVMSENLADYGWHLLLGTRTSPHELIFSTVSGKPISPNNVLRRWVWPACQAADLQRVTWLTFRRTYSSWAHDKGVPAKVVAQIMGHTKVDTTMNVYTQVLDGAARVAADRVGSELFRIVQIPDGTTTPTYCGNWLGALDDFRNWLVREAA